MHFARKSCGVRSHIFRMYVGTDVEGIFEIYVMVSGVILGALGGIK